MTFHGLIRGFPFATLQGLFDCVRGISGAMLMSPNAFPAPNMNQTASIPSRFMRFLISLAKVTQQGRICCSTMTFNRSESDSIDDMCLWVWSVKRALCEGKTILAKVRALLLLLLLNHIVSFSITTTLADNFARGLTLTRNDFC